MDEKNIADTNIDNDDGRIEALKAIKAYKAPKSFLRAAKNEAVDLLLSQTESNNKIDK